MSTFMLHPDNVRNGSIYMNFSSAARVSSKIEPSAEFYGKIDGRPGDIQFFSPVIKSKARFSSNNEK